MKAVFQAIGRYLPLALGLGILVIAIPLVPWGKVWPYLIHLSPVTVMLLILCSLFYYLGRIVRYWLMLRMLGRPLKLSKVALACLIAQPVSVLPAGELYRAAMLRRYGNVSMKHGAPSVFAQSIAETTGLLIVALIGAAVIHEYVVTLLIIAAIFGTIWAYIRWHDAPASHRFINRFPWVHVRRPPLRSFLEKNRFLLSGSNFLRLVAASFISILAGIAIIYIASHALGSHLSFFQASLAYALPVVLEAVSFLPGGLGINENSSVAVLTLFHVVLPVAVALTLLVRLFTLGVGFGYGFAATVWARLTHVHRYN